MAIAKYTHTDSSGRNIVALEAANDGSLLSVTGGVIKVGDVEYTVPSASYTLTTDAHRRILLVQIAQKLADNSVVVRFDVIDAVVEPRVHPTYHPTPGAEYSLIFRLCEVTVPAGVTDFSGLKVILHNVQFVVRHEPPAAPPEVNFGPEPA